MYTLLPKDYICMFVFIGSQPMGHLECQNKVSAYVRKLVHVYIDKSTFHSVKKIFFEAVLPIITC